MAYTNIHPIKVTLGKSINYICKFEKTGNGKYISSYIGFAPADDPQVIAICLINEPVGIYYGGTIAAPVISSLYEDVLPYLEIKKAQ